MALSIYSSTIEKSFQDCRSIHFGNLFLSINRTSKNNPCTYEVTNPKLNILRITKLIYLIKRYKILSFSKKSSKIFRILSLISGSCFNNKYELGLHFCTNSYRVISFSVGKSGSCFSLILK